MRDLSQIRKRIGYNFARMRVNRGYTLAQLAERLNIREKKLAAYKIGKHQINLIILNDIARLFKCDVGDFFGA